MNTKFSNKIYNINFILIVMIVLLHSSCMLLYDGNANIYILKIVSTFCDSAVPLFFVISSYLFYRCLDYDGIFSKIKRRFKTLVVPYFLWGILFAFYYYLITKIPFVNNFFTSPFDFTLKNTFYYLIMASCAQTMWFVRCLIIYVCFSPLVFFVLQRKNIFFSIIILLLLLNLFYSISYSSPIFWAPIYLFGAYMSKYFYNDIENMLSCKIKKCSIFSCIVLICTVIIANFFDEYSRIYYIYRMVSPFLLFIFLSGVKKLEENRFNYGKFSFWIFCIHLPIIQIIKVATFEMIHSSWE